MTTFPLLPRLQAILTEVGANIRLARLRRQLSTTQVAERAGISRPTLLNIEKGAQTVSIGSYVIVLFILGQEKDLLWLAVDDVFGRKLQDAGLETGKRAPQKPKMPSVIPNK